MSAESEAEAKRKKDAAYWALVYKVEEWKPNPLVVPSVAAAYERIYGSTASTTPSPRSSEIEVPSSLSRTSTTSSAPMSHDSSSYKATSPRAETAEERKRRLYGEEVYKTLITRIGNEQDIFALIGHRAHRAEYYDADIEAFEISNPPPVKGAKPVISAVAEFTSERLIKDARKAASAQPKPQVTKQIEKPKKNLAPYFIALAIVAIPAIALMRADPSHPNSPVSKPPTSQATSTTTAAQKATPHTSVQAPAGPLYVVSSSSGVANVRKAPDGQSEIAYRVNNGLCLSVYRITPNGWAEVKVRTNGGPYTSVYIFKDLLKPAPRPLPKACLD